MSCCGNKRTEYVDTLASGQHTHNYMPVAQTRENAYFEYTGKSALTITGSITGRKYRFQSPGDVQEVDYRDAGSMMAVPVLKPVKTS